MRDGLIRPGFVFGSVLSILAFLLAALIVGTALIPASAWHHPQVDARYTGFDPNLIYMSAAGPGTAAGVINLDTSRVVITALPGSHPTIHLTTTPLTFSASFAVEVDRESLQTVPLRIGIWSPATRSGYFLMFDHDSGDVIRAETVVEGIPRQDLVQGTVRTNDALGQYAPGRRVQITITMDEARRIIHTHLVGADTLPPAGAHALRIGSADTGVTLLESPAFAVASRAHYTLGSWVNNIGAPGAHAIGVVWFDKSGRELPSNADVFWKGPGERSIWLQESAGVVAPLSAVSARVVLGVGAASPYMFGDVYFRGDSGTTSNLLANGSFADGMSGWKTWVVGKPQPTSITTIALSTLDATNTVTANELPELFEAFRPTLTLSASSTAGAATAIVSDYALTIPSQPTAAAEEAERVHDPVAAMLVQLLLLGAIVLTAFFFAQQLAAGKSGLRSVIARFTSVRSLRPLRVLLFLVILAGYFAMNAFLFLVAPLQWDQVGAKVWSYVAHTHGVADLYYEPLTVTLARVAQGVPVHEAAFPYGITAAYLYQLAGDFYHFVFPGGSVASSSLDVILKSINVLFAIADGALIYAIVRSSAARLLAAEAAVAFLLCPAVIFVMSVWGSTETVSLFFVLAAIWAAENKRPVPAYLLLAAAAFTRPQMMVLAFLLGLVYMRKFGAIRSIAAVSWTAVMTFIALAPFEMSIGPSFPVDYIRKTLIYHFANGQTDPNYLGLTPGYYSIWTLPLELISKQHGVARMWSPSTLPIVGSYTYGEAATALSVLIVVAVGVTLVVAKRFSGQPALYLPLVAFGMLGWLLVTPGLISRYFVYAIALVIVSRQFWSRRAFFWITGTLTVITFVTAYGHLALDSLGNGTTTSPLNPLNNVISDSIFNVFSDDRFITLGAVANIVILASIGAKALSIGGRRQRDEAVTERTAAAAVSV